MLKNCIAYPLTILSGIARFLRFMLWANFEAILDYFGYAYLIQYEKDGPWDTEYFPKRWGIVRNGIDTYVGLGKYHLLLGKERQEWGGSMRF
jgi:hypothetical protein